MIPMIYDEVTPFNAQKHADVCRGGVWQIIDQSGSKLFFTDTPLAAAYREA